MRTIAGSGVRVGIRPGEVLGLRWSDFDLPKKELTINRQIQYEKGKGFVYGLPKTVRKSRYHLRMG